MKASIQVRVWYVIFAILIIIGIALTGFSNVHWFLYFPPAALLFAAVTGICPSQIAINKVLGK
jgi:hypothetical protein